MQINHPPCHVHKYLKTQHSWREMLKKSEVCHICQRSACVNRPVIKTKAQMRYNIMYTAERLIIKLDDWIVVDCRPVNQAYDNKTI